MTTSVLIRIVLIVALVVFFVAWRGGLREKWKSRTRKHEEERLAAERAEARRLEREKARRETEKHEKTSAILLRSAEGARMQTAKLGGAEVAYLEAGSPGSGPSLLFLHGLVDRKEDWGALVSRLGSLGCHAVAPDLPGCGQSTSAGSADADVLGHLKRLELLAERLRMSPVYLVGADLGSLLAAAWAYRRPESVAGLALFEPFGLKVPYRSELDERIAAGSNPLLLTSPTGLDALDAFLFETAPERDPELRVLRQRELFDGRAHLASVWARSRQEDRIAFLDLALPEIQVPLLYVQGGNSRVVHPSTADLVRSVAPDAEICVIPGCGHLPQAEKPQEAGSALLRFVQQVEGRRREAAS